MVCPNYDPSPKVRSITSILDDRQRRVVQLHFYRGMTQQQIGGELGLSQQAIGQIIHDALEKLRDEPHGFVAEFDPEEN
jgi:RNA polymerase sigma factor (sigma-70 family)